MTKNINQALAYKLLFVDDSEEDVESLVMLLRHNMELSFDYQHVMTSGELETALREHSWDVVVCDFVMPPLSAPDVIQRVKSVQAQASIILVSSMALVQDAVDMMRLGASAFVEKMDHQRLIEIVKQELKTSLLRQQVAETNTQLNTYRSHLNAILDSMQDALFSITLPERQVVFVSHAFEEVMGYSHERFMEDPDLIHHVLHPDDVELALEAMQTCLREGFVELDHRIILPDGQVRWLHRRAWVNYDENGQPIRLNDSARDITKRKQVENELLAREQQLKSLIDSQTTFLIRTDLEGRYTYWNPKFEQEFAWLHEPEGMLGSLSLRSICAYHYQRTQDTVAKCFANPGVPFQVELDKPKRDGSVCTTLWEFICLTDAKGSPTLIQCVGIDITAQKQAQATVQYQANLLQQVSDAVITLANDMKIIAWNKAATEIYGWTEEEAVGQWVEELLKTEWLTDSLPQALEQYEQQGHWHGEVREVDKSGKYHYIAAAINKIYNEKGDPVGGVIVNRDISKQKQADKKLQVSEDRQRALLNAMPDLMFHLKADGTVLDYHSPSTDDFTLPAEQFLGKKISETFLRDYADKAMPALERVIASQEPFQHLYTLLIGEDERYFEARYVPAGTDEVIAIVRDVSKQHQAELALHASEEKYRSLIESSEAAISLVDYSGTYLYLNKIAAYPFGVSPDALVGKTVQALFPPEQAKSILHDVRQVIDSSTGMLLKTEVTLGDASAWFRTSIQPVKNGTGQTYAALVYATEFTEEKLTERRIVAQNQILHQNRDLIAMANNEGIVTYINQGGLTLLGADSEEDFLNKPLTKAHLPEDIEWMMQEVLPTAIRTGYWRGENRLKRLDGGVIDVDQTIFPIHDADGKLLNIAMIVLDVTARKEMELVLKHNEERYRRMFEAVRLPKLIIDPQTARILDANLASVDFYGYPLETLRTMSILQINVAEPAEIFEKMAQASRGELGICLFRQRLADGNIREVEGFVTAIELDNQKVLYCTYVDMTERNHALAELEEANQRLEQRVIERTKQLEEERNLLRTVIDTVPDFIYVKDTQHRMVLNNIAHARSLGKLSSETVIGKTDMEIFPAEMAKKFWADEERLFETQAPVIRTEERSIGVDGSEIWALTTKVPLRSLAGQIIGLVGITHDVTQIKLNEEALRQSEQRLRESENMLRMVLDTIPVRVFWKDTNSKYLGCNRLFAQDAGLVQTSDIVGKYDTDLPFTAQQSLMFRSDDVQVIETLTPKLNYEEEITQADGETKFLQTSKLPMRNAENEIVGVLGTYIDITERKQAEAAMLALSQRLQLATDAGGIGIWDWNTEKNEMLWDDQMYRLYGIDDQDFTGTVEIWEKSLHPEDAVRAQAEVKAALSGEKRFVTEFRIVTRDGDVRHILAHADVYWHEDGTPYRMIGVNMDITAQKTVELALRESEEKFRTFIESAPIATIISNIQGQIILANKAVERLFDYKRDELMGQSVQILVPDEVRNHHQMLMDDFVYTEQRHRPEVIELSARHKDGTSFPVDIQLSRISIDPEPVIMVYIVDITDRKQAEDALKRALEKEKELGEMKSRFVSTASHQFRTPLAAILSTTETLTIYRDRMNATEIDERLDRIRTQVNRMKRLMDEVLELARIQANQVQYRPEQGDLDAFCREVIGEFTHQRDYLDRIVYDSPSAPLLAEFDAHLMHHVIANLIHNALKYSQKAVYVSLTQTDLEIIFKVNDQGIGIPANDLDKLFLPFTRASNVKAIEGTGLGLSIVKQAVECHQGSIDVESIVDVGTTFIVKLPHLKQELEK